MIGIYKITSPSGKIYIGQSWNIERRRNSYRWVNNVKGQWKIFYSMKKYGTENHKFDIIELLPEDVSQAFLDNREIYWWQYYKDLGFEMLNIKEPGKGGKLNEFTKQKISKSNRGKIRTEEMMNKIKALPRYNKPILMLDLEGKIIKEFRNINSCSRELGTTSANINSVIRGKTKTCLGHIFVRKDEYNENNYTKRIVAGNVTEVNMYDLEGNFIKTFLSFKELMEDLQFTIGHVSNIIRACKKDNRTAYGYKWKYKNEGRKYESKNRK